MTTPRHTPRTGPAQSGGGLPACDGEQAHLRYLAGDDDTHQWTPIAVGARSFPEPTGGLFECVRCGLTATGLDIRAARAAGTPLGHLTCAIIAGVALGMIIGVVSALLGH